MRKHIKNALLAFSLALAMALCLFTLPQAQAAEAAPAENTAYLGYLVLLREPASAPQGGRAQLAQVDELPEDLVRLSSTSPIYAAPDLDSIRDLVYAGRIAVAEPNYRAELFDTVTSAPNDPFFADNRSQYGLRDINVQAAWDAGLSGRGVTIAVIDSGICEAHEDLPLHVAPGRFFYYRERAEGDDPSRFTTTLADDAGNTLLDENGDPRLFAHFSNNDTVDDTGHGTATAGIIGAPSNNGKGISGIAPGATILPIRTFSNSDQYLSGFVANIVAGIDYAVKCDAKVISMSFGILDRSSVLERAINDAANAGCLLIASVGNDNNTLYRYPANYKSVIGVGATQRGKRVDFSYSQRNDSVHVFAPGSNIYTLSYRGGYMAPSGTSFACPAVAATAALLLEADPRMTHSEFARLLTECSAHPDSLWPAQSIQYTTGGLLDLQQLVDAVGASVANLSLTTDGLTAQACFHPSEAQALQDNEYLILTAAYNSAGHLLETGSALATRSVYGGYQYTVDFTAPEAATVRAFLLRNDGTLAACLPPVERSVGQ